MHHEHPEPRGTPWKFLEDGCELQHQIRTTRVAGVDQS